jgi:formylglycine-generating enzyme required for sulfatase activity
VEEIMARVFVSYSRKNKDFCRKLTDELQRRELDFWVDWEGIPPTVDWMKEIEKGIEEADTFLVIVSPDWISSKICLDELDIAVKNGKRLIPVVPCDIPWNDVPRPLAQLNFIFFTDAYDFNTQFGKLFSALDTDYAWLKTQRRLQMKALEWDRADKENGFLLRGRDLEEAEQQISINATKDPHPTDLQREYVLKSRQASTRQRRITTGILSFIIVMLIGITAYLAVPRILEGIAQARARGEMVLIPAGETIFGTENLDYIAYGFIPRQTISYDAFEIGKYEVTNYQYSLCVEFGNGICSVPADQTDFRDESKQSHPVTNINVYQANAYCRWLGQRLPTEIEWERAARGPDGNDWPWGNDLPTEQLVNMQSLITLEPTQGTEPVDSHPLSASQPENIYNLIGNVWEWTSSYVYEINSDYDRTRFWNGEPETFDGSVFFVQRGGGWEVSVEEVALYNPSKGLTERPEVGVRCAADVE